MGTGTTTTLGVRELQQQMGAVTSAKTGPCTFKFTMRTGMATVTELP